MAEIDVYATERAGFAERLGVLAGTSTWREPLEGHSTAGDHMPHSHALAAALAFARRAPNDIGPDLLLSIVYQRPVYLHRVIPELAAALLAATGRVGEQHADRLLEVARWAYLAVVTGEPGPMPDGIEERDWLLLTGLGQGFVWDAAEVSCRRAERAYKSKEAA